jgi:hypothetical protein
VLATILRGQHIISISRYQRGVHGYSET